MTKNNQNIIPLIIGFLISGLIFQTLGFGDWWMVFGMIIGAFAAKITENS